MSHTAQMTTFAKRVKSLRMALGLNKPQLAAKAGVTKALIGSIEKEIGGTKEVKMLLLFRLAAALGVSARFLATGMGSPLALGRVDEDEADLVYTYRKLSPELKTSLLSRAHTLAEDSTATSAEKHAARRRAKHIA